MRITARNLIKLVLTWVIVGIVILGIEVMMLEALDRENANRAQYTPKGRIECSGK